MLYQYSLREQNSGVRASAMPARPLNPGWPCFALPCLRVFQAKAGVIGEADDRCTNCNSKTAFCLCFANNSDA